MKVTLDSDEQIIAEGIKSWKCLMPEVVVGILCLVLCMGRMRGGFSALLHLALLVVFVLMLIRLVSKSIGFKTDGLVVTNKRIIGRAGLFSREKGSIPLSQVSTVTSSDNILSRMFGFGRLDILLTGGKTWRFPLFNNYSELQDIINNQIAAK